MFDALKFDERYVLYSEVQNELFAFVDTTDFSEFPGTCLFENMKIFNTKRGLPKGLRGLATFLLGIAN